VTGELVFGCDYCGAFDVPESSVERQIRCRLACCAKCLRRPGRAAITRLAIKHDWTPDEPPLRKLIALIALIASKRVEPRA